MWMNLSTLIWFLKYVLFLLDLFGLFMYLLLYVSSIIVTQYTLVHACLLFDWIIARILLLMRLAAISLTVAWATWVSSWLTFDSHNCCQVDHDGRRVFSIFPRLRFWSQNMLAKPHCELQAHPTWRAMKLGSIWCHPDQHWILHTKTQFKYD